MPALTVTTSTGARYRTLVPRDLTPDERRALDARLAAALRTAADPEAAVKAVMDEARREVRP